MKRENKENTKRPTVDKKVAILASNGKLHNAAVQPKISQPEGESLGLVVKADVS